MQEPKEQAFSRSERERRFRFHLSAAEDACEEARHDHSPLTFTRCISHAQVALSVAKKANRPDLEQHAQLALVDFLEIAGRRREAAEARIIAAAMMDNLELKYDSPSGKDESRGRLASVGGIPIDEVIRLLEDGCERRSSYSGQAQSPDRSNVCDPTAIFESQEQQAPPKAVLEGRQIRDLQGRLATVLTEVPTLRRKPNFNK